MLRPHLRNASPSGSRSGCVVEPSTQAGTSTQVRPNTQVGTKASGQSGGVLEGSGGQQV